MDGPLTKYQIILSSNKNELQPIMQEKGSLNYFLYLCFQVLMMVNKTVTTRPVYKEHFSPSYNSDISESETFKEQ